ncbi:MAG: pantoate--beta-alanine ligase, partial [Lachnospiraceae bacterium]
ADIMFCPKPEEMYYPDKCTFVDMNQLTKGLCGKTRPVHFSGVCTVVTKLFNIVTPDRAYFGEKDAQQLAVIKRMVRDLNFGLTVVGCPIVREADGLALSSRNTYLNMEERKAALILNSALTKGKEMINSGETNAEKIKELIVNTLLTEPLARIDYVEIVDGENLEPVEQVSKSTLIAIAVLIGKTRLIDNVQYR